MLRNWPQEVHLRVPGSEPRVIWTVTGPCMSWAYVQRSWVSFRICEEGAGSSRGGGGVRRAERESWGDTSGGTLRVHAGEGSLRCLEEACTLKTRLQAGALRLGEDVVEGGRGDVARDAVLRPGGRDLAEPAIEDCEHAKVAEGLMRAADPRLPWLSLMHAFERMPAASPPLWLTASVLSQAALGRLHRTAPAPIALPPGISLQPCSPFPAGVEF